MHETDTISHFYTFYRLQFQHNPGTQAVHMRGCKDFIAIDNVGVRQMAWYCGHPQPSTLNTQAKLGCHVGITSENSSVNY